MSSVEASGAVAASYPRAVLAIVLALGTSLAYGTSNFLGPRLNRLHPLGAVLLVGQCAALIAAFGSVLAAQGSEHAIVTAGGVTWALLSALGFGGFLIALPEAASEGTAWALFDARVSVVVLLAIG